MMSWEQKAVLHDHLDGSIALLPILQLLFERSGKSYPFLGTLMEQREAIRRIFVDPQIDIVAKFANTTGVLQKLETLSLAAEFYVRVRAEQGWTYAETTIAPQYHMFKGLTVTEIIAALIEGIQRGEAAHPEIEVNILFTVGRELDPDLAVALVEQAGTCNRDYIVGVGLACDEASHPPEKHQKMFARAKALGFKTTCHAGEWVNNQPDCQRDKEHLLANIRYAVYNLKVNRVGQAIPLAYDARLVDYIAEHGIGIEGCPGSNLTSKLIPNTEYLRIRDLLQAGVLYSLNPDDDLFLPNLNETFALCEAEYHFSAEEKALLRVNPWKTRFGARKTHRIE